MKFKSEFNLDFSLLDKYFERLGEFFDLNVPFFIDLKVVDTRAEYNKLRGKEKSEPWEVGGCINGTNKIVMLSPTGFKNESSHSSDTFYQVLAHEVAHAFLGYYSGSNFANLPRWFNEGFAGFIAEQYLKNGEFNKNCKKLDLTKIVSTSDWKQAGHPYGLSFLFLFFINKSYTENLKRLLLNLKNFQNFDKLFSDIFGKSIKNVFEEFIRWFSGNI